MSKQCAICGQPEAEHHEFVPVKQPTGCVCEPEGWSNPVDIPPMCDQYDGDGDGVCLRCQHDKGCHAQGSGGVQ